MLVIPAKRARQPARSRASSTRYGPGSREPEEPVISGRRICPTRHGLLIPELSLPGKSPGRLGRNDSRGRCDVDRAHLRSCTGARPQPEERKEHPVRDLPEDDLDRGADLELARSLSTIAVRTDGPSAKVT